MPVRPDVLLLSAHLPELAGMRPVLGDRLRSTVGGLSIEAAPIGVGVVAAAVGAANAIRAASPRAVIFTGTSGAYPGRRLSIGDVVVAAELRLVSPTEIESRAAFPPALSTVLRAEEALSGALAAGELGRGVVATVLAITIDDRLSSRIGASGCDVEHLETFAVAAACETARVPFAAVLGVANHVGMHARAEWQAHHVSAGEAACAAISRWLGRGAPGLEPDRGSAPA